MSAETKTVEQAAQEVNTKLDGIKAMAETKAEKAEVEAIQGEIKTLAKKSVNKETFDTEITKLTDIIQKQGKVISMGNIGNANSFKSQVKSFIEKNFDKIKEIKAAGSGLLKFEIKAVGDITTGAATTVGADGVMRGVQAAPPSNANLRAPFVDALVTTLTTSLASYPYTDTLPKEGDFLAVAEGNLKPQIDFSIETKWAEPKKVAAWMKLTDESLQDIPGLQSIANDYLRKKHDLKRQNYILFGDGVGANPNGATAYGRVFAAGDMATAVVNPNFLDVVNAAITDIYATQNYTDEMAYMPNTVIVSPTDYFIQFVSAKNADGNPLYPTASLFNRVNIGGVTIIPERTIPAGKIFVADMGMYNVTNYIGYNVSIGWVNDDFIKNQFVMLGESRMHAFVKELDKQAFLYDDIATIKTAITAA